MRVLISSTKFSGHLNPLLPYADALIAMGHDVAVAAPEAVSQRLAQAGIAHLQVGEPAEGVAEASRQRIDAASGAQAVQAAAAEHFADVLSRASLPDLKRIIADWRPDLVLRELLELGALVAAAAAAIPCCRVGVHCGQGEMDFFPHLLAPVDRLRGAPACPATTVPVFAQRRSSPLSPTSWTKGWIGWERRSHSGSGRSWLRRRLPVPNDRPGRRRRRSFRLCYTWDGQRTVREVPRGLSRNPGGAVDAAGAGAADNRTHHAA